MNAFHRNYIAQIKQLADQMRTEQIPSLTEELFALFEMTGNRLSYEKVFFTRRKFLAVFGMASYIFKRKEDMEKLEEVLLEICEENCWALPAHVNRRENPDWKNTIDLFASETAQTLAEITGLVAGIRTDIKERICSEIERRVLCPFEQKKQGWECSDHNWNAVCSGSIGSAAMYLLAEKEDKRLEKILLRICHSLNYYLDGFREDGACMEGIGYFTYGMTYFTGFAEQLLRYSKGKTDLFENEKLRKIAEFQHEMYFTSGQTVSFSDVETNAKFRMGLTAFLSKQYDTVQIPNPSFAADFETDPCYRFMGLMQDYKWIKDICDGKKADAGVAREKEYGRHDVFPYAGWSICESRNGTGFAIKGGDNGEPHNHNDVGSFIYVVNGEQLLCDLGAGEYTADYFGTGRYAILCNSSKGHSVPVINGSFQMEGAEYKASFFKADGKGTTQIEFSGAYKEGMLQSLIRKAAFSPENGDLEVEDSFCFSASEGCFTENLITKGKVKIQNNTIVICGKQASCKVKPDGAIEKLRVLEQKHSNHEGEQETVRLIQWDVIPEYIIPKGEKGEQYHGVSKYTVWQCGTEFSL